MFLERFYRHLIFALFWRKLKVAVPEKSGTFLPDSIMVVRQILVLFVEVRILVGQQYISQ
jgi:hypothetical protein